MSYIYTNIGANVKQLIRRFQTVFFLLIVSTLNVQASSEHNPFFLKSWSSLASIHTDNIQNTFRLLTDLDIDIAGVDYNNDHVDVLLSDYDFDILKSRGIEVEIKETKGITRGPDEEYQNPDEIATFVKNFADSYPHLTQRVSIGKSLEGRDIWALKISDNANLQEKFEPAVLFNSMHHAREVMTPEISIDIIEYLLTRYETDNSVKKWVDNNEIWVIPMFNVDGNNKMWNFDKWWRKNTRDGHGVDLNRNYPTGWNKCNGSSGRKSSQTYRGPSPASEPETQAMMKFIEEVRPVFDISYHAYSELVIFPFGCSGERTATKEVVEKVGKDIAAKLGYKPGTAWELLYNADGGDIDWMYDVFQVIPYVIEVNSSRQGFQPSYSKWRDITVEKNRVGWMHILDRVGKSGVRGVVTSAFNDITINVSKLEAPEILFQTYKVQKDGTYHIILNPGKYTLEFKSSDQILDNREVEVADELVRFNVEI